MAKFSCDCQFRLASVDVFIPGVFIMLSGFHFLFCSFLFVLGSASKFMKMLLKTERCRQYPLMILSSFESKTNYLVMQKHCSSFLYVLISWNILHVHFAFSVPYQGLMYFHTLDKDVIQLGNKNNKIPSSDMTFKG